MRRASQNAILGRRVWLGSGMHRGLSWLTSGRRERGIKGLGRVSINANSVLLGHRARPPRMPTHTLTHSRANRTDRSPEFWGSPTLRGERGSCALSLSLSPKPPCAEDSPGELENAGASALCPWVVFGPSNLHSGARGPGRETGPAALSALSSQALLTLGRESLASSGLL